MPSHPGTPERGSWSIRCRRPATATLPSARLPPSTPGRIAEPEEIASMIVVLASPLASFVTGANVAVDGGLGSDRLGKEFREANSAPQSVMVCDSRAICGGTGAQTDRPQSAGSRELALTTAVGVHHVDVAAAGALAGVDNLAGRRATSRIRVRGTGGACPASAAAHRCRRRRSRRSRRGRCRRGACLRREPASLDSMKPFRVRSRLPLPSGLTTKIESYSALRRRMRFACRPATSSA